MGEEPAATSNSTSSAANWIFFAVIAGLVLLYFGVVRPATRERQRLNHPAVGEQLAYLQVQPLTGRSEPVSLDELRGKVVLVNLWGTWCGPCRWEFPDIVALEKHYRGRNDVQILAVSYGTEDDTDLELLREETRAFLKESKADLPTYADPNNLTIAAASKAFKQHLGFPTTFVLDRTGTIRGVWQGYVEGAGVDMQKAIDELVAESDRG